MYLYKHSCKIFLNKTVNLLKSFSEKLMFNDMFLAVFII